MPSGKVLEAWDLNSLPYLASAFFTPPPEALVSSGVSLYAGADYWLVVSPGASDTDVNWAAALGASPYAAGSIAQMLGTGDTWTLHQSSARSAFDVVGVPVPEPASEGLSFIGVCWLQAVCFLGIPNKRR